MAKNETPTQEKQYYVLVSFKSESWKKGQIISITQDYAKPYLVSKIITPLRTALNKGQYVPDIEIATYVRPAPTLRSSTNVEPEEAPKKKTLLKNTLRDAVLAKKDPEPEAEPTEDAPEETKKPVKESKKPDEPTSSSAAEDAIKAKIAAAKKTKKK